MNITSKVHKFVEHAEKRNFIIFGSPVQKWVSEAVIFNCGDADDLPPMRIKTLPTILNPPFQKTIFELSVEEVDLTKSTVLIFVDSSSAELIFHKNPQRSFSVLRAEFINNKFYTFTEGIVSIHPNNESAESILFGGLTLDNYAKTSLTEILVKSALWAAHIFRLLRCKNVVTTDNHPPAALNKKRIAAGKVPIYSHKTLHLRVPVEHQKYQHQGGTHASPRIHLRRGHIRTLADGREIWVNEAVVGKKHGLLTKDYHLRP